jgi:dihydroneopterin triphosphate diphosphatase
VTQQFKKPVSVLVLIHTPQLNVLLLERASHPGFWQSVTGSQEAGEPIVETAIREVAEETGIDARRHLLADWQVMNRFQIFAEWRRRYADGVTYNSEHVFGLTVPEATAVRVAADEHLGYMWLPWMDAADKCFSWTNRNAILMLPRLA